jgi:UDP-N-acetylglucosamine 1-carboxyvinyltransferase
MVKILQRSGVPISLDANRTYTIEGRIHTMPSEIEVMPDRLETFSYAIAALTTKGDVFLKGAKQEHLLSPISNLISAGAGVDINNDGIRFFYKGDMKPMNLSTGVYPSFATDLQVFMALLLSQCNGQSQIHETVHESRFKYMNKLMLMSDEKYFKIESNCPQGDECWFDGGERPHVGKIFGPVEYKSAEVNMGGEDIRSSFTVINAGLIAQDGGESIVKDLKSLYRGYEDPVGKLKALGADIQLVL